MPAKTSKAPKTPRPPKTPRYPRACKGDRGPHQIEGPDDETSRRQCRECVRLSILARKGSKYTGAKRPKQVFSPGGTTLKQKVLRSLRITQEGCWVLAGYRVGKDGYHQLRGADGRLWFVHRWVATTLVFGPIAEGNWHVGDKGEGVVHHECRNRACCNPDHLHGFESHETHREYHALMDSKCP